MTDLASLILAYELRDDPGNEREVEVKSVEEARAHLASRSDMVVWADLTDEQGVELDVALV